MNLERDRYVEQLRAAGVGLELAEREATRGHGAPRAFVGLEELSTWLKSVL